MNICIVTRSLPVHRTGGLERHTFDLAKGLVRKGNRVTVITTAHPEGSDREEKNGVLIHYLPGTVPSGYTPSFFSKLNRAVLEMHDETGFDILHSQGFAGLTFRPPPDLSFVATLHGTLFSETPLHRDRFQKMSLFEKVKTVLRYRWRIGIHPLYKRYLKRLDLIFVDSDYSRKETMRDLASTEEKIRIVPLGIDISDPPSLDKTAARKRLNLPPDKIILFTLSRLEALKGIDVALEAAAIMKGRNLEFKYIIGGEGRLKSDLELLRKKLELNEVKFAGKIPDDVLSDYFTAADFFIYPEISHPAFGLVSVESMFHGTAVLGSKSGAIPEVVKPETGRLFERGDPNDLAEKLIRMIEDISEWNNKDALLRSYVENYYSLDRYINDTIKIYAEVKDR